MQKQLQLLQDLQELDKGKLDIEKQQQVGLAEQQELQQGLDRLQEMSNSLAEEISLLESGKKELLNAMTLELENVTRSEERLPQIKTQKEYVAVLKEVDTAKKMEKELQAQIDAKNQVLESLNADKAEKDAELASQTEQANAKRSEIDTLLVDVKAKLDKMGRQRDNLMKGLPTSLRKRYELLMARRAGVAVVEARNGACQGCHMHLPPQMYNSLFILNELQTCPHCNRLLFVIALS